MLETNGKLPRGHSLAKIGWATGIISGIIFLVWALGNLLTPLVLAFFIAYILDPVIDRIESWGINRTLAIALFLMLVAVFAVVFTLILVPVIQVQASEFADNLPRYMAQFRDLVQNSVIPFIERTSGKQFPRDWTLIMEQLPRLTSKFLPEITNSVSHTFSTMLLSTRWLMTILFTLFLLPVFTFYILRDFDIMKESIAGLFPRPTYKYWVRYFQEIDESLSSVIRGQLTVCLVLGTMYAIGLSVVGLPLGIIIGMITGLLAFIPYVGFAIGMLMALLMAVFAWNGISLFIGVIATYVIVQIIDGIAITPRILGGKLKVNPVIIIVALMVGGRLFGFIGVLLAVPVTAVLKVTLLHIIEAYQKSPVFLGEEVEVDIEESNPDMPVAMSDEERKLKEDVSKEDGATN